ncbi:hypothetical protein BAX96_01420 [Elizabethkingia anophelis]|uniref:hypothetical protein n=1 Tax=Elizabethkingia anophelis TaxID=1117645 RepID=UPI000998FA2B|nr:hypothetical protein [Elizabethkingia anophelis]MCT3755268.1 hypothetical protein [Elizabethkingia anophelis]MCT4250403.1 hypothetical protein [Elizabethkingia anophelis]MCT4265598.1 hypothetical protein [Elizabethkingia anophelis]MCT4269206.1 hypothetical protein [Elizabethkingia anophelis]OPC28161.1 hypothetical protein BAX96_01420 [Elizabethkingia anophelis]
MIKYTISDIKIGDGVYFNVKWQKNYDLYWTVISIYDENTIEIEVDEMGVKDKFFLKIQDVYLIQKR